MKTVESKPSLGQRWKNVQPTKSQLIWACVAAQANIDTLHLRHQLHVLGKPQVGDEDDQVYLLLGAQNMDDGREFFSTQG